MTTPNPTPELKPFDDDELDRLFDRLQKGDAPTEDEPDETPTPEPTNENAS